MTKTWLTIGPLLIALFAGFAGYQYLHPHKTLQLESATWLNTPRTVVPFVLKDSTGHPFTDQNLLNHWTVLFFGYTHCPDVCPTTLALLSQALKKLPIAPDTQFVFVSVDPARDNPSSLNAYVHFFNPHFMGATGTDTELAKLTHNLGVVYVKVPNPQAPNEYAVDHTGALVVINPRGEYQAVFTPPFNIDMLTHDLTAIINSDNA
jgi:protein SCO1